MKKLFCLILFTFFVINQPLQDVFAEYYSKYNRYSTTALLGPETSEWDSYKIQYPNVIFDDGLYKMWYSGHNGSYWSVGYALSLDGINWYKYPYNPVLTWDNNENHPKHIITPSVIKDGNTYKMWFTSSYTDKNDYDFTIGNAVSNDGIYWQIQSYNQLSPSQNWDNIGLTHPFVVKATESNYYIYYSARVSQNWNIGYAVSDDGMNWVPYTGNPIITTSGKWWEKGSNLGPHVIYDNATQIFKMWYSTESLGQGSSSMAYAESSNANDWIKSDASNPVLNRELTGYFDDRVISDGSACITGDSILLWYAGKASDGKWRIGLSYYGNHPTPLPTPSYSLFPTPTANAAPTPTSTPSSTPIPTSTPTPTPLAPIVIIPGMFSSWNKEALLESKQTQASSWTLLPFVKEYSGLINTLKRLGYTENTNIFIWPYDWRQPVASISNQLNSYLDSTIFTSSPNTTINLVGHSLGGLVARTWAQANQSKVRRLITVGSPNQGVIQPYRAWEGGDIKQDNTFLTLLTSLLVKIQKTSLQTNREVVQKTFPVLRDLLPTSPYLVNATTNTEIPKESMQVWNTWLTELNTNLTSLYPVFDAIIGSGSQTPLLYKITNPSQLDKLLGNWIDGKPVETLSSDGDDTVLTSRAAFTDDPSWNLEKTHGGLIASKEGIEKILQLFAIDHTEADIQEGSITSLAPGMIFLLRSPATLIVSDSDGNTYTEQNSIVVIPNAKTGTYQVNITGTDNGTYHLLIGQFTETDSAWSEITNTISTNAIQRYDIAFNATKPSDFPISSMTLLDWLNQIDIQLSQLSTSTKAIQRLRIPIIIAKRYVQKKNLFIVKIQLEQILLELSHLRRNDSSVELLQQTLDVAKTIQSVYSTSFKSHPFFPDHITKQQQYNVDQEKLREDRILGEISKKKAVNTTQLLLLQEAQSNVSAAQEAYSNKAWSKAYVYYFQAHLLYQEAFIYHR